MRRGFYVKLAISNIRKNAQTYVPYMLTGVVSVMMFYIISSLAKNEDFRNMRGGTEMSWILYTGTYVVGFFACIFLFYTNSFLIKRRKKELGLYNILGMEKRHIFKVLTYETLMIGSVGILFGILGGLLFSKLVFLGMLRILNLQATFGFPVSVPAIRDTVILFAVVYFLTLFSNLHQIHLAKPVELLRGGQVGEREPRAKVFVTLLGVLSLGGGYWIAVTTKNPMVMILIFFVAVLLVMVGTYCLFTSGSIAVLKTLRRKKSYYYKTQHFISVSGMMYRMKQNAVGLANICILSTAVLVMISSTVSLYIGFEDNLERRYPREILLNCVEVDQARWESAQSAIDQVLTAEGRQRTNEICYRFLEIGARIEDGEVLLSGAENSSLDNVWNISFMTLKDLNQMTGESLTLDDDEVILYTGGESYDFDTLRLFSKDYRIREKRDSVIPNGGIAANIIDSLFVVVPDRAALEWIYEEQSAYYQERDSNIRIYYGVDIDGTSKEKMQAGENIKTALKEQNFPGYLEVKESEWSDFMSIYGGLFFLGIFLGTLFLLATVLIIYYKQVSEGYEDKERFVIMQKVGLSRKEIKKTIHSQILTVFFLPLLTAGIHIAFAFPAVNRILRALGLMNQRLLIFCTLGSFLVFALIYVGIYLLTARVYDRIVQNEIR
ncbi:ABC transporter permease [Hominifimenecus sp. rT4P-3]|uniref:ABC transporter permease n=1 Tax=Hominifimenecus sp. rT4P-3 TaxID=3242979 RepID=UPI003DA1D368